MSQIRLESDLTIYQVAELKPSFKDALLEHERRQTPIELDLSGVTECDGAGLQLLLALANAAAKQDAVVVLCSVPQAISDLLEQFHISSRFNFQE